MPVQEKGVYGESLHLLLNLAVSLKFILKNEVKNNLDSFLFSSKLI